MIAKAVHPHKELVTNPRAVLSNPSPVMGNPEPPVNRFQFHNAPLYRVPRDDGGQVDPAYIPNDDPRRMENLQNFKPITDENGNHQVFYHNTNRDFSQFNTTGSELGAHFGTPNQAANLQANQENPLSGRRTMSAYLSIQNPLRLKDEGNFSAPNVANQLYDMGLLSDKIYEKQIDANYRSEEAAYKDLHKAIEKAGYDGVVYLNRREGLMKKENLAEPSKQIPLWLFIHANRATDDEFKQMFPEAEDSYIAFKPTQIKSATGNRGTFDPHDGDITKSDGGEVDPAYTQADLSNTLKNIKDPNISMPSNLVDQEIAARGYEEGGEVPPPPMGHNNPPEEMQPEEVMQKYQNTGLQFPAQDASARLATKIRRDQAEANGKNVAGYPANERTTIKAPEAQEGQKQLPDFTTGNITYDDWIKRHEQILNHNEIHNAANWYKNVYSTFKQHYPDEEEARKNMRAWLVAQQNISPAGAMNNVLMQKEQMARQIPEHLWKSGGMPNPTEAARAVLKDQPIEQGVGQKISDFVDAAEGKPVRSWMGNHPHGGSPFVVDVHTARDTGMVDDELINHLSRLGYDPEQLSKLKVDLKSTPTEAAYENRARFGQGLTNELNKRKWMGRDDWTPAEVQAVGWMGMTKLTRNAEEDSESGLNRNLRRISYELDPGNGSPWASKYGDAIGGLLNEDRADLTNKMTASAMKHAANLAGIGHHTIVHGTGAWEQYQNPAAVTHALSTKTGADIAANALGYLLNQTEVWHNRAKPMTTNPKGFGIDFIEKGTKNLANKEYLQDFWDKVMKADTTGLLRGFQPIQLPTGEVGIRSLIDKGGEKNKNKIEEALREGGSLRKMLEELGPDIDVHGHEAEITKAKNDWKEDKNGQSYLARLGDLLGSDPSAHLNSVRSQLENELEGHLDRAYKKTGKTWRKETSPSAPQQVNSKPIKKKPAKPVKGSAGSFASGGHIVDQALRITSQFGNQLPSAVNLARSLIRRRP
jgi:hypothetical protein